MPVHHAEGDCPLLQSSLAGLHHGAVLDGEMTPAVPATVGHGFAVGFFAGVGRPAMQAKAAFRPALLLEPLFGGGFVGKQFEHFHDSESLPWPPSGHLLRHAIHCLGHG